MVDTLLGRGDAKAPALSAPGRPPLDYAGLRASVARVAAQLEALGIEPGDAVALASPNGPEALAATLGVASVCAVAPLNPGLTAAECRFLLEDLSARALLACGGASRGALEAARDLGLPVVAAGPKPSGLAKDIELELPAGQPRRPASLGRRDPSVALLLHTSGTTSRPKLVAVRREALVHSATAIARGLSLEPSDVCLNVMPLFHVHGLVGAALASLAAGASVCCTSGFDAMQFARWLDDAGPTWYTAVPSMHQAIVGRLAGRGSRRAGRRRLRFVRSCSSPLPAAVRAALSACFEVPVVNAYGMTEAAHQVSSTPLGAFPSAGRDFDPAPDLDCSVGWSSGPEVRVLGSDGTWAQPGQPGEILLRGKTVITAYERPPEANAMSFHEGWLRTGDQGTIDERGEIRLIGRLKELINTAGEKVSPYEVEDALLSHPSVAEAVCFAIPSPTRGEVVGAAVVLKPGAAADPRTLRRFLGERLAPCKLPDRVLTLAALPKGPTGKLQRIGLAARLGL